MEALPAESREILTLLELPKITGIVLEIRGDSNTVAEWIDGKAKQKTTVGAMGCTGPTEGMVGHRRRFTQKS